MGIYRNAYLQHRQWELLALPIFWPPLLHRQLSLKKEESDDDIPIRIECSEVSHPLHIFQLWVS